MGQAFSGPSGGVEREQIIEEGSERERINDNINKEKMMTQYYIAPLLDDSCPVLEVSRNIMEIIFSKLSLEDLSKLSQSCRSLNVMIGEYLRHETCSSQLEQKFTSFVKQHINLLTITEQKINSEISSLLSENDDQISRQNRYKLLHFINKYFDIECKRISVANEEVGMPHRGNPRYVPILHNDKLNRSIVHVNNVCWLAINYKFTDVSPGRYSLSLRLSLERDFQWPHGDSDPTEFTIAYPSHLDEGHIYVRVFRDWWQHLSRKKSPNTPGITAAWEVLPSGGKSNWISVILDEFVVARSGEVHFEMKDVVCPWWKSGLYFDFIELRKLQ